MSSGRRGIHGLSTRAVHAGQEARRAEEPVVTPIVQSSNYAQEYGTSEPLLYTRYGNTPNAELVQRRVAVAVGTGDPAERPARRGDLVSVVTRVAEGGER